MNIGILTNQMNINEVRGEAQSNKRSVNDDTAVKPVRIFVGYDKSLALRYST